MDFVLATVGAMLAFMTFVGGQYILKLVIEPVQEVKKTIGMISHALIIHGKIISSPNIFNQKQREEVYEKLNALSAQLQSDFYLVPKSIRLKSFFSWYCLFNLPSQTEISEATHELETLANCVVSNIDIQSHNQIRTIKKSISCKLDIHFFEERPN